MKKSKGSTIYRWREVKNATLTSS